MCRKYVGGNITAETLKEKLTKKEQKELNRRLSKAVWNNDLSAVKTAIDAGADVNTKGKCGKYVLHKSIVVDIKILEYLLKTGADTNLQDKYGDTALHNAVYYEHVDETKLLLKYKANMYIKNNNKHRLI